MQGGKIVPKLWVSFIKMLDTIVVKIYKQIETKFGYTKISCVSLGYIFELSNFLPKTWIHFLRVYKKSSIECSKINILALSNYSVYFFSNTKKNDKTILSSGNFLFNSLRLFQFLIRCCLQNIVIIFFYIYCSEIEYFFNKEQSGPSISSSLQEFWIFPITFTPCKALSGPVLKYKSVITDKVSINYKFISVPYTY